MSRAIPIKDLPAAMQAEAKRLAQEPPAEDPNGSTPRAPAPSCEPAAQTGAHSSASRKRQRPRGLAAASGTLSTAPVYACKAEGCGFTFRWTSLSTTPAAFARHHDELGPGHGRAERVQP